MGLISIRTIVTSGAIVVAGAVLAVACADGTDAAPASTTNGAEEAHPLASIPLRNIGPAYPSGRISDFAFYPGGHHRFLAATASGGLWATSNHGVTWTPIFDNEGSYALGVVEIAPSDPSVIWVGSGENNAQRSVAYGDGVYVSVDGGKSWENKGLKDAGHISQIWIDPNDANTVLVAAQGPLWNEGGDRGLYKTVDGGETWERLLEIDEHTGVNEFLVHADDPNVIVASSYQRRRHVWTLINGGPGSGVHRSDDGGATWQEISSGLPASEMGRIGLAASASSPNVVYAIIEANDDDKGVYRSADFGRTWEKRSGHMTTSPQYYNEIVVDPKNPDRVYSLDTFSSVSNDGGKTFTPLSAKHRHVDDHALWIDPHNTDHLFIGGDGGIYESFDGGEVWRHFDNLPITQFYRASPDNDTPFYNVCGGTQDNNSLCGPSRTSVVHGITNSDWKIILGGDGYKPQSDPTDPNIIYTQYQYGGLARYDRRTQERLYITPMPPSGENNYKWNWNTPLLISPHNPTRIYYAAEKVFRSDDRGDNWEIISPDLTRQINRNALDVMGRVWSVDAIAKNDSTSIYGSIIGFSESPVTPDLLYAGTDDGVISVSENGGGDWRSERSFPGVPDMSLVEDLVASVHDENVAYAVFDNHKRGDYKPYVYKTSDKGRSWRAITGDLPEWGSAHTIAEDHEDPDLLFVGTEFGLFFTQNGGASWHKMDGDFPTISVRDLEIQRRENDLVVATFGRGIYILDDYTPLRAPADELKEAEATLFPVKDPWLYVEGDYWGVWGGAQSFNGDNFFYSENPAFGAVVTYYLSEGLTSKRDARLKAEAETLKEGGDTPYPSWDDLRTEDREDEPAVIVTVKEAAGAVVRRFEGPSKKGLHRVAWDLRYEAPDPVDLTSDGGSLFGGAPLGPLAAPGDYTVEIAKRVNGVTTPLGEAQSFTLKPLELSPETTSDPAALLAFQTQTSDLIRAVAGAGEASAEMHDRLAHLKAALDRTPGATPAMAADLKALETRLDDVDVALLGDATVAGRNEPAPLSVEARVETIRSSAWSSQAPVAGVHEDAYNIAAEEFESVLAELSAIGEGIDGLETSLGELGAPWTPGRLPVWSRGE
ncbi:MAG: glycosyl hydrolase [Pseudomonadota bacterium]